MTEKVRLINLNDGKPVIEERDYVFAPGTSIQREFFIENVSDEALYYRLFFENIEGTLGEYLEVTISDGNNIVATGPLKDLKKNDKRITERYLKAHEKRQLCMTLSLPRAVDDSAKDKSVVFDMRAIAIQAVE